MGDIKNWIPSRPTQYYYYYENDIVPHGLPSSLRTSFPEANHTKLVLKTDKPSAYVIC